MPSTARDTYLETEVMTATPQKLQWMLLDGAVRFVEQTREFWRAGQPDMACETLARAEQIVTELLASLNPQIDPALAKRVAATYLFIFRRLIEAGLKRDEEALDDARRVLEEERETWRQVCAALGATRSDARLPGSDRLQSDGDSAGLCLEG